MTSSAADEIDFDYATSVARRAVGLMLQHRVPPTPENFSVWYRYAGASSTPLKQTIDALIGSGRAFDPATNRRLHVTFVDVQAADRAVGAGVSDQLTTLMSRAQQFLHAAIDDSRTQMRALDGVAAEREPRRLIESLVSELSQATRRATALEANFAKTSEELGKIRSSLEEAEQRSKTDMLTGLANRHALEEFLTATQSHACEQGAALSAFMIDIDNFKTFNDNYGHVVGDQVLRLMASVLREHVGDNDLAARYGGEELMAVFPGADLQRCRLLAERIRASVAERRIRRRTTGEEISPITISTGVAELRPGEAAENLIDRCDRALYRAKRDGRNRVMTEEDLDETVAA